MLAVDTNLVVRLIALDDPEQAAAARRLLAKEAVWISKSVLLETYWVLTNLYGFDQATAVEDLRRLTMIETTFVENVEQVEAAFALAANGLGFADAMHVASTPEGIEFATFDKILVKRAQRAGLDWVVRAR